jgi:phosphoglycerate dehydrogenase-like enzyme
VVHVACETLYDQVDLGRIAEIVPGSQVVRVPFALSSSEQARRERDPWGRFDDVVEPALVHALADAEVVLTLYAPAGLAARAPRLRWLHCVGSGTGHLVPAVGGSDITLTNSAGAGAVAIAEFVLARILEDLKRLPDYAEWQRERRWVGQSSGRTLHGRTVAVVGFGAIGRRVSVLLRALGARVLAVRRSAVAGGTDPDADEVWGPADLDAVLARADVVVLAVPGNDETADLLDGVRIASMPRGSMVVNVGRGTLVDEVALAEALRSGHLRSAAIDVAKGEPLDATSPLWDVPHLRISPHSSSDLSTVYLRAFDIFCDNLARFAAGDPLRNVVTVGPAPAGGSAP